MGLSVTFAGRGKLEQQLADSNSNGFKAEVDVHPYGALAGGRLATEPGTRPRREGRTAAAAPPVSLPGG